MEDEAVSVYHDDRRILYDTKTIKIIITKLLSLCLTTKFLKTEAVNVNLHYMALFSTCSVSKMEEKAGSDCPDVRKSLDNIKIDGGIPPNFDKKVISDIELMKFATEVDNVKRW